MQKKALITGIDGQDGSYLAELLLSKGYQVYGLVRKLSINELSNISHLEDKIKLIEGDLLDTEIVNFFNDLLVKEKFNEIYHLAAVTFVPDAKSSANSVMHINTFSIQVILDSIFQNKLETKVFYASSAEAYNPEEGGINESSIPNPTSAYGLSKQLGQNIINFYQQKGIFCCYGILFNHESVRRGRNFVTRKITSSVSEIKKGNLAKLELGNIEAFRDWGSAEDFVKAYFLMLQNSAPKNYVIGTGETHSVKELLEFLFQKVGLNYQDYIEIKEEFYREELPLIKYANIEKIQSDLNWKPEKKFEEIFIEMLEKDLGSE